MAYSKTTWKDRAVQKPLTYTLQNNADGTITLIPAEGTIVEPGTAITAAVMNNLEKQYDEAVNYVNATPTWINATLQNGWVNNGGVESPAGYCKTGTTVRLRGIITSGTVATSTTLFTLPVGYRPSNTAYGITQCSGNISVRIRILTTGEVQIFQAANVSNTWLQLDGITFTI